MTVSHPLASPDCSDTPSPDHKTAEHYRAQLAAIVEFSDDAIISKSLDGHILTWNAGAERMFGYCANDMIGRPLSILIPPDRADEDRGILSRLLAGDEQITHLETVRLAKDGRRIEVSVTISPIKDAAGKIIAASKVCRDITQRKAADEHLRQLNATLEQRVLERTSQVDLANKELRAFSFSVSHDLRAPLRGIDGWSLALMEDYSAQLDDRGREYLRRVRSETQRMGRLIDDLLRLSSITQAAVKPVSVDLSALARKIADRLAEASPARNVEFVIEPGLSARGDAGLLEAAMTNLIDNAWKFTGKKQAARIEFGRTETNGSPAFYVKDNGAGFDPTHAVGLFSPFQRAHNVAEFPGTGIGLATVQRIINRHGGSIWVEAQTGLGATFFFSLGSQ